MFHMWMKWFVVEKWNSFFFLCNEAVSSRVSLGPCYMSYFFFWFYVPVCAYYISIFISSLLLCVCVFVCYAKMEKNLRKIIFYVIQFIIRRYVTFYFSDIRYTACQFTSYRKKHPPKIKKKLFFSSIIYILCGFCFSGRTQKYFILLFFFGSYMVVYEIE